MDGARGRLKGQVRPKHTVFNHVQQEGCRAHLEVGRDLRHIRVPDHDVEPPIPRRISQRLISRVDDGVWSCCALEHRSLTALRQAVLDAITRLVRVPRPSEYLARDEERDKGRRQACEIDVPPHKVGLVAAVVIPRTIRIVFEEAYLCRQTLFSLYAKDPRLHRLSTRVRLASTL